MMIPIIRADEKPRRASPPKRKMMNTEIKVVNEVIKVRLSVSEMEVLAMV